MAGRRSKRCPCPDGCGNNDCIIATSDFESNLNNITTVAGSLAVSGGVLPMTAGDLWVFTDGASDGDQRTHISTFPQLTSGSSGEIRLLLAYADANNYKWGRLTIGGGVGTLRIGEVVEGADTELSAVEVQVADVDADLLARHQLTLCAIPGVLEPSFSASTGGFPQVGSGGDWTTPEGVTADDATSATIIVGDIPTGVLSGTDVENVEDIPAGSRLTAIDVTVSLGSDGLADVVDHLAALTWTGGSAPDKATGASVPVGTGEMNYSWTEAELSAAGLTLANLKSPTFGFSGQWVCPNPGDSAQLSVGHYSFNIDYTTPDLRPGLLRLNYYNVTGLASCTIANADIIDGGLQGGVEVVSGDWDLTEATYYYGYSDDPGRTACPDCACTVICELCCPNEPLPSVMLVNLGAVSLSPVVDSTSSACSGCGSVGGTVATTYGPIVGMDICFWTQEPAPYGTPICDGVLEGEDYPGPGSWFSADEFDPDIVFCQKPWRMNTTVNLTKNNITGKCKYSAGVALIKEGGECGTQVDRDGDGDYVSEPTSITVGAGYEGEEFDVGDCPAFPLTLTKVNETAADRQFPCTGTFPNTITIEPG